jgi:hypothetical protein
LVTERAHDELNLKNNVHTSLPLVTLKRCATAAVLPIASSCHPS